MAKKKARSPANGEQQLIPELAPVRIEKIHRAAKRYATERDGRIAANKEEKDAHEHLLDVMKEHGLMQYEYGDLKVFVDEKVKCKVTIGGEVTEKNGDGKEGGEE